MFFLVFDVVKFVVVTFSHKNEVNVVKNPRPVWGFKNTEYNGTFGFKSLILRLDHFLFILLGQIKPKFVS